MVSFDLLEKFNLERNQGIALLIIGILIIIGFIINIYSFFTGLIAQEALISIIHLLIFLGLIVYCIYGYSKSDKYFKVLIGLFLIKLLCVVVLNADSWVRLLALISIILFLLFIYKMDNSKIALPVIVITFILSVITAILSAGVNNTYLLIEAIIITLSFAAIYWSRMKRGLYDAIE